jgi:transposase
MTRDEAELLYEQGKEAVVDCLVRFAARLQALEEQVAKNSGNSSKPPSSDGLSKPTLKPMPQSLRKKNGKKPGGQKGHSGKTLLQSESPHQVVLHHPATCSRCHASLNNASPDSYLRRQVFEMPEPTVVVTEHRAFAVGCSHCGTQTAASFPKEVASPTQYGPNLLGFATYLHSVHLLPYARCAQIVNDITGVPFSPASLHRALGSASERLSCFEEQVKVALEQAPVQHTDETGSRVSGKLHWIHVRSTPSLCHLFVHEKRGKEAVSDLLSYGGSLMSDFYTSYVRLSCRHLFCGAHLLRELTFAEEVLKQSWAGSLQALFETMVSSCHAARERGESYVANTPALLTSFDALVAEGLAQNPLPEAMPKKRGRVAKGKARCLLERLRDYRVAYLAFLLDLSLPFTNNEAERDLRMFKVKGKVSGCFRTREGANVFCRLRSYVRTCQKQAMPLLKSIRSLFEGQVNMPQINPT